MQTVLYDGSFEGLLCAIFDVYEYRFKDVQISTQDNFKGNIFGTVHTANDNEANSRRVWKGLEKKLSIEGQKEFYRAFLSEHEGIETVLLQYARHVFENVHSIEKDFSHPAVIEVVQTAKKVWREKHRMEAFVRFQKTTDGIYFAPIEPDSNVLPIITSHFTLRYADQPWIIYDTKRDYGMYYNLETVVQVSLDFFEKLNEGKDLSSVVDEKEVLYQVLWKKYFKSVNIEARKNTRLHVQHMPKRYWRFLTEKQ